MQKYERKVWLGEELSKIKKKNQNKGMSKIRGR